MIKKEGHVWIGLEYFCNEGDDLWNQPDAVFARNLDHLPLRLHQHLQVRSHPLRVEETFDLLTGDDRVRVQVSFHPEPVFVELFGKLIDEWRWGVFSGEITPDNYNQAWWDLREQYQGVAPPVERSEADFDPGAKYHIPGNVSYTRYFLARILQFQFHRALCETAGHEGDLHACSIFGNEDAGAKFYAMLEAGEPVLVYVDMGFLPYFVDLPDDYHFGGHVVAGVPNEVDVVASTAGLHVRHGSAAFHDQCAVNVAQGKRRVKLVDSLSGIQGKTGDQQEQESFHHSSPEPATARSSRWVRSRLPHFIGSPG